jgi:hypothetical protein
VIVREDRLHLFQRHAIVNRDFLRRFTEIVTFRNCLGTYARVEDNRDRFAIYQIRPSTADRLFEMNGSDVVKRLKESSI